MNIEKYIWYNGKYYSYEVSKTGVSIFHGLWYSQYGKGVWLLNKNWL